MSTSYMYSCVNVNVNVNVREYRSSLSVVSTWVLMKEVYFNQEVGSSKIKIS